MRAVGLVADCAAGVEQIATGVHRHARPERVEEARFSSGCRRSRAARPPRAERAAGAHEHAALGQAARRPSPSSRSRRRGRTSRSWPGSRPARRPSARRPSSSSMRSATVRSTRSSTASWWLSASTAAACAARCRRTAGAPGRRRAGSSSSRTARSRRAARTARRPWRRCAAARGWGGGQQVERGVGVVEHVELAVGLVEDHADVRGAPAPTNAAISASGSAVRRRVVGVADDDQARRGGDLARASRRGRGARRRRAGP